MAEQNAIDLSPFCGRQDYRKWMREPFAYAGRSIATDGHIIVALDPGTSLAELEKSLDFSVLLKAVDTIRNSAEGWTEAKSIGIRLERCNTCKGSGHATNQQCGSCEGLGEFEHWGWSYDCQACDQYGYVVTPYAKGSGPKCPECQGSGSTSPGPSTYGSARNCISGCIIQRIRTLPNAQVRTLGEGRYALRFDGGVGVIMGYHDSPLDREASDRAARVDVLEVVDHG